MSHGEPKPGDLQSTTNPARVSAKESPQESVNESQETRRFDSEPIRVGLPRPGLVLRQRYRLDSELGRGAMGIVFRATDLELLRPVAVKVLAERLTKEEQEATTEGRNRQQGQEAGGGKLAGETPAVPGKAKELGNRGKGERVKGKPGRVVPASCVKRGRRRL